MDLSFEVLRGIARHSVIEELRFGKIPTQEDVDMVETELLRLIDNTRQSMSGCLSFDRAYLNFLTTVYPRRLGDNVRRSYDITHAIEEEYNNLSLLKGAISDDFESVVLRKIDKDSCPVKFNRPDLKAIYEVSDDLNKYKKYLKSNKGKVEEKYLNHCSLNERWAGIVRYGLKTRPKGIVCNGKSLGEGIYFTEGSDLREGFMSRKGSFTEDSFVGSKIYGIFQAALTDTNHATRGDEICVFDEDAVNLKYLVELWAV